MEVEWPRVHAPLTATAAPLSVPLNPKTTPERAHRAAAASARRLRSTTSGSLSGRARPPHTRAATSAGTSAALAGGTAWKRPRR